MAAETLSNESVESETARIAADPVSFIRDTLGCNPWSKQVEIAEAVRDHKHVAVRSCHGAGKDYIAGRIVLAFAYGHDPVRVITTGPTDRQVRGILWKEISSAHRKARKPLPGRVLTQELDINEDRFAIGFTTTTAGHDEQRTSRFQGWHAKHILVVIDEAAGVSSDIYTEVAGLLSSADAHLLEIGNPTNPSGEFAAAFKSPGVYKIKIAAFDTPNFTAFGITQEDIEADTWQAKITGPLPYPELITPEWVAERYRKWGVDSPLYLARVLAEFPSAGIDTLIPLAWIERAQQEITIEPQGERILSVDVARFGSDKTVLMLRQGGRLRTIARYSFADTMTTAGYVKMAAEQLRPNRIAIDVVGLGAGVYDRCAEQHLPVSEFNSGEQARDSERFINKRAETYWLLREAIERGQLDLDPQDEDLASQLAALKWKPDSRGRVQIESKDDMRRRGMPSPDDADAAAMTFFSGGLSTFIAEGSPRKTAGLFPGITRGYTDQRGKVRW